MTMGNMKDVDMGYILPRRSREVMYATDSLPRLLEPPGSMTSSWCQRQLPTDQPPAICNYNHNKPCTSTYRIRPRPDRRERMRLRLYARHRRPLS